MDLKKLKNILFDNIELVLSNLDMEFEVQGTNIYSSCPIHEGSDNPTALSLCTERQIWRCWTRNCHEDCGTDIISLIMAVLSVKNGSECSFSEALRWCCDLLKLDNKGIDVKKEKKPNDFVRMVNIFEGKNKFAKHNEYNEVCKFDSASKYFMNRGFKEETLNEFMVSDCYEKNSSMYNRAIIPIHDYSGEKIVSHIGRSVKDFINPKFLFSKGFNKSRYIYNYHRAIDAGKEKSCLFITEGQGDVWRLFEAGIMNSVSIFGKSISKVQREKIVNSGITKLVVLTDNDQAGREAKMQIQRDLSRLFKIFFPRMKKKDIGDMTTKEITEFILPQVKGTY